MMQIMGELAKFLTASGETPSTRRSALSKSLDIETGRNAAYEYPPRRVRFSPDFGFAAVPNGKSATSEGSESGMAEESVNSPNRSHGDKRGCFAAGRAL